MQRGSTKTACPGARVVDPEVPSLVYIIVSFAGAGQNSVIAFRDIHPRIQDRVLRFLDEVARLVWSRRHGGLGKIGALHFI